MTALALLPAGPPRHRIRLVYWAVGLAVVLAGAAVATITSVRFDGPAPLSFVAGSEVVSLPTFGDEGSHVLLYRHGETVTFSLPLENHGAVPLTVTGVRLSDRAQSMLEVERVSVGADELPVRLAAGESAALRVTARYGNCRYYHEREIESFPSAVVDVDVLGLGVTRTVAFDHPLVLHSPMIVDCPDRTLRRDDDVRG